MTLNTFQAAGTNTQPERLVLGSGESIDESMITGEWISSDTWTQVRE